MHPKAMTSLTAILVATVALAGCAGDALDEFADAPDDRAAITAESEVAAPSWQVGDWFGHHVFLPNGLDFHINAIVLDDAGDTYHTATDDEMFAKLDAMIDVPFFGEIQKSDLTMRGLGTEWDLYEFPLQANKTWTNTFTPPTGVDGDTVQLTFTATFEKHIQTALGDVYPGFQIQGNTSDGTPVLEYDYVPAIGFYAHFWLWEYDTEDPEDYIFHAMNMGFGSNWTGTYYDASATLLLDESSFFFPNTGAPANSIDANPHHTFTLTEDATSLVGSLSAFAISGTAESLLIDPNDNRYEARAVDTEPPTTSRGTFVQCETNEMGFCEWDAVPGEWQASMGGAASAHIERVATAEMVLATGAL